jgi:hypothetical protein
MPSSEILRGAQPAGYASMLDVCYPHGGPHVLLHWWTQHDRGHIVVARSGGALHAAAEAIAAREPYAEVKALLHVEIVAPPRKLEALSAVHKHKDAVAMFRREVCCRMSAALKVVKTLPPPFAACDEYVPELEDEPDGWAKEHHFCCKNCIDKVMIRGMTSEQLYETYAEDWMREAPGSWEKSRLRPGREVSTDTSRLKSRARIADEGEKIWCAWPNFGHHAGGVELREVDMAEGEPGYPGYFDSVLFYFKQIEEMDQRPIVQMFEETRLRFEEDKKQKEAARRAEHDADDARQVREVISFFSRKRNA